MQRASSGLCLLFGVALSGCSDAAPEGQGTAGSGNSTPGAGMSAGGSASGAGTGGSATAGSAQGGNPASTGGTGSAGTPSSMGGSGGAAGGGGGATNGGSASGSGGGGGGPGGDTWESYAKGFMETYCVSCHNDDNAGSADRNYHMLDVVKAESEDMACGLAKSEEVRSTRDCGGGPAARQFPPGNGPKPEDAERDRILAWIDAGMP